MTREHKLALIVGFSLVLLVGVLIADHLSLARRAQIAPVGEKELTIARGPSVLTPEAVRTEPAVPVLSPHSTLLAAPPQDLGVPIADPILHDPQAPGTARASETAEPVEINQGRPRPEMASISDADLIEQVRQMGGSIRQRSGILEILPPAAAMDPPMQSQRPAQVSPTGASLPSAPVRVQNPPAGSTAAANFRTHAVQSGDTYSKLAQKYYGNSQLWRELAKFNGSPEGVLKLGTSIKLPPQEVLTGKPAPASAPAVTRQPSAPPKKQETPAKPSRTELAAMTYTVQRGETLGDIAMKKLGTSRRWKELAEYNGLDDPDHVPAGTVLKLPPMRG